MTSNHEDSGTPKRTQRPSSAVWNNVGDFQTTDTLIDWALSLESDDLPTHVYDRAQLALLDTMASMAAGTMAEGATQVAQAVADWGGIEQATVFATGTEVPTHSAALANGTAARAWDLDDVLEHAHCHISATVVPVLLSIAESLEKQGKAVTGREFVSALAAGLECVARLALAPTVSFSETGAAKSYECGTFAAVLAGGRLLGLSKQKARHAMGIALVALAGKQQGYLAGAHTVRIAQGLSAQSAIQALDLAGREVTGASESVDVLTGQFGYYFTIHRKEFDRESITEGLGNIWHFLETSVKPLYPCCKFTHTSIQATIDALRDFADDYDRIQEVIVQVTDSEVFDLVCTPELEKRRPSTVVSAQFSMPYAIAVAGVYGEVTPHHFLEASLKDNRVLSLAGRVTIDRLIGESMPARGPLPMPGNVTIRFDDGTEVSAHVEVVAGHPSSPVAFEDVAEKYRECAGFGQQGLEVTQWVIEFVAHIGDQPSIGELMRVISSGSAISSQNPADK